MKKNGLLNYRPLKLEDVYTFKNWGHHDSILYYDYNFCQDSKSEMLAWYNWKTKKPFSKYFAITIDEKPIGFLSLKKINKILKSATLGIVIDPNYINMKIGTKILNKFFKDLEQKGYLKIYLYVASFNKRAIHLYENLGFKRVQTKLMAFQNGKITEDDPQFVENKECFKKVLNKTFFYAYKMELHLKKR